MSCLTEERIQQWVDHELDPVLRRAADEHLAECAECSHAAEELVALVQRAEELPRSIEPDCDLWPEIEQRLAAPGPVRRLPIRWAQVAGMAAVLALGVWIGTRLQTEVASTTSPQPVQVAEASDAAATTDADYTALANEVKALRRQVETFVADRSGRLDQPTLAAVNDTLATLQLADTEISQAIERDPQNRRLRAMRTSRVKREAHVLADLMVALNGASMVGIEPTT